MSDAMAVGTAMYVVATQVRQRWMHWTPVPDMLTALASVEDVWPNDEVIGSPIDVAYRLDGVVEEAMARLVKRGSKR